MKNKIAPAFFGYFSLPDITYAADDLSEVAERLAWAAEKVREMHRSGVQFITPRPDDDEGTLRVGTTDREVAERWELKQEPDGPLLSITAW